MTPCGPGSKYLGVEFLNAGSVLTHVDLAPESDGDFGAVLGRSLIPARRRDDCDGLCKRGKSST